MPLLFRLRDRWGCLGLQARLNLQLAFLTAVLFAVLLAVVLTIQTTAIRSVAQENGFGLVRVFAFSSAQGVIADDFLALRELARSLARQPEVRYAKVLDLNGRAIMHSRVQDTNKVFDDPLTLSALKATEPVVRETQSETGENIYDFVAPVLVLNERRAVARLGISFEQELRLLRYTRNIILGLAVLTLVGGLVWVHWLYSSAIAADITARNTRDKDEQIQMLNDRLNREKFENQHRLFDQQVGMRGRGMDGKSRIHGVEQDIRRDHVGQITSRFGLQQSARDRTLAGVDRLHGVKQQIYQYQASKITGLYQLLQSVRDRTLGAKQMLYGLRDANTRLNIATETGL